MSVCPWLDTLKFSIKVRIKAFKGSVQSTHIVWCVNDVG